MSSSETKPTPESRLVREIEGADAVQIREVVPENAQRITSTIEQIRKSKPNDAERVYLVRIRRPTKKGEAKRTFPLPMPETRDELLAKASILIKNEEFVLARNIYSFILKKDVKDKQALIGLGTSLMRLGQIGAAKKCFTAIADIHLDPVGLYWLGKTCIEEGDETTALKHFENISHPEQLPQEMQVDLFKQMGNCFTRNQSFDLAQIHYSKALKIKPSSAEIQINLGNLEVQRNQIDVALHHFKKAKELEPTHPKALCGLGIVCESQGDTASAIEYYEKTLDVDSQSIVALFQLANLVEKTKGESSIQARVQKFLGKNPSHSDVQYLLAKSLFQQKKWSECEKQVDAILKRVPSHEKAAQLKSDIKLSRQPIAGGRTHA